MANPNVKTMGYCQAEKTLNTCLSPRWSGASGRIPLPREDDVFFRPGVHLLTMRASQLVILERRIRVEIFIDREARRSELRCGRAPN